MLLLTFNPGLTLTGFQTTQPSWLTEYFFFSQHEANKSPILHLSLSLPLSVFLIKHIGARENLFFLTNV